MTDERERPGEELGKKPIDLGMFEPHSGDRSKTHVENIWICRTGLDALRREAQAAFHRVLTPRFIQREAARPNRGRASVAFRKESSEAPNGPV